MSTKTMRLPPRRVSMPNNNKRKDGAEFDLQPPAAKSPKPIPPQSGWVKQAHSNQLLAGYFAYEFLTRGTVLGQMRDPARSQAAAQVSKPNDTTEEAPPSRKADEGKYRRYVEVANLLKTDGAHLPGIVNPSDLARFLQM